MSSRFPVSPPTPPPARAGRRFDEHRASRQAVDAVVHLIWPALRRHGVPERDRYDLLQDILVAALEAWPRYDAEVATPQKWLNAIILHHIQRWRARCAQRPLSTKDEYEHEDNDHNPEDAAMLSQLAHQLYQEIPFEYRDAFIAYECEGLSINEIAASRGIPRSTAHFRIKEGRRQFEAALARWKAKHRDRGLLLLPLTANALLDADRTTSNAPDHVLDFAWRHVQRVLGRPELDTDSGDHERGRGHDGGNGTLLDPSTVPATASEPPAPLPPEGHARPVVGPVVVALLAGLITGAWLDSILRTPHDPIAHQEATVIPAPPPVASVAIVPAPSTPASVASPAPAPAPAPNPSASAADADVDADFALETTMLDIARVALTQRDMSAALRALERHARRFPRSKNAVERDRMRVAALIGLGRTAEACRRADMFRTAYPKSDLHVPLDRICSAEQ